MELTAGLAAAYLIGAIPFAYLIARAAGISDIRRVGSGNVGATNVLRTAGFRTAVWVFAADIGKGAAAVLLASLAFSRSSTPWFGREVYLSLAAIAAVIGHIFPVFLRFKGGKGVNTAVGAMAVMLPLATLMAVVAFGGTVALSRYVSLGSIIGSFTFALVVFGQASLLSDPVPTVYLWLAGLLPLIIIATHLGNIRRLLAGTEHRFGRKSNGGDR